MLKTNKNYFKAKIIVFLSQYVEAEINFIII